MRLRIATAVLLVGSSLVVGQGSSVANRQSAIPDQRVYPPRITLTPHPAHEPISLSQLVGMSKLIVQGTVVLNLLPIRANPEIRHTIETHSVISIDRVFLGTVPGEKRDIVLVQQGGKLGSVEVVVPSDPIVKPGERYVLFLAPDDRTKLEGATEWARYYAVGFWAGKVKIQNDTVSFLPRTDERLKKYDSTGLSAFLQTVDDVIKHRPNVMPDKQTPIPFPGPGRITEGTGRR